MTPMACKIKNEAVSMSHIGLCFSYLQCAGCRTEPRTTPGQLFSATHVLIDAIVITDDNWRAVNIFDFLLHTI